MGNEIKEDLNFHPRREKKILKGSGLFSFVKYRPLEILKISFKAKIKRSVVPITGQYNCGNCSL